MSKKSINNRLEKLFEEVTPEETKPKGKRKSIKEETLIKKDAIPRPRVERETIIRDTKMTGPLPALDSQVTTKIGKDGDFARLELAFPIDTQNWATLQVLDQNPERKWDDEEKLLVKQVTDQLSLALENARLFQQTQQQAGELAILNEMGRELAARLEITAICEAIYRYTSQLMDTTNFFVSLYNQESKIIDYAIIINDGERIDNYSRPLANGLSDYVLSTGRPLFLPDNAPERMKSLDIELITIGDDRPPLCWLGVPLSIGNRILGVIAVQSVTTHNLYTQHHYELLASIANQSAIAIANAQLFQQTEQQASELTVLNEMGRELSATLDIDSACRIIYKYTSQLMNTDDFFVALFNEQEKRIDFPFSIADNQPYENPSRPLGNGLTDYLIQKKQPLLMPDDVDTCIQELGINFVLIGNMKHPQSWMGVPLMVGERAIGAIVLQSTTKPHIHTSHHLGLLGTIGSQAAISLENARLFEAEQRRSKDLNTLFELSRLISQNLEQEQVFEIAYQIISKVMPTNAFFINIYDPDKDMFTSAFDIDNGQRIPPRQYPGDTGFTGFVIKNAKPYIANDLRLEPGPFNPGTETGDFQLLDDGEKYTKPLSLVAVPLVFSGQISGAISAQSFKPNSYTVEDLRLMQSLADTIAIGIQNARLFESEKRRASELNTLVELSRLISQNLNLEEVYATAHNIISNIMTTDAFFISTYEPGSDVFTSTYDIDKGVRLTPRTYPIDVGFTGHVIKLGNSYIAYDIDEDSGPYDPDVYVEEYTATPRSVIATPLRFSGQIIGVISAQSHKPNVYTKNDLSLLESYADTIAIGIQNARLFEQTELRAEEMGVLNDLGRALSTQLDVEQVLQETYRGVARLMDASNFFIGLYDDRTHIVNFPINITQSEIDKEIIVLKADEGMTGHIFRNRSPLLIKNNVNAWMKEHKVKIVGQQPLSWLGVPLMVGNQFLGLMAVQNLAEENAYNEHDRDLLLAFANQAAIALQNALLFQQTRKRAEIERLTSEISTIFASIDPVEVPEGIDQALEKLGIFSQVDRAYVFLVDDDKKVISCVNEWCSEDALAHIQNLQKVPIEQFPYLIQQLRSAQIFYAPNVSTIPKEGKAEKAEFEKEGIQSIICMPFFDRGELIGFLGFDSVKSERTWSTEEQNLLKLTGETIVTALSRQQAMEALSKSEAELRALFNSMTDVIIVYDGDGRYIRIAPTNPNRLYKPLDHMIGRTIREVLPPETHEPFIQAIHRTLDSNETTRLEYPLEIEDNVFWFDASVTKLSETQVFWVSRDITERKQAEEAIRRQNEYLSTAAEIGRLITSTLDLNLLFTRAVNLIRERFGFYHAGIFIVEETGFNAILKEATGDAGEEMKRRQHAITVGSKSVVGLVTSNAEAAIINNTAIDATHRPNPLLPETRAEAGIPLRVGNRVIGVLDIQSTEVDAFTPDNIAVLQILADQIAVAIDNARSYELAQQAVKEMREVDRLKSQFLANMSHELRTPLNSIIGFSRVILKGIDGPISELQQQDLNAIYNSGQHLLGLINDILDLSRIEAGKMELTFDEVNLGDTINSVLSTITGLIKDRPITLKKIVPENIPPVRADAMRIRQVLLNLLSNAAKFTEQGAVILEAAIKSGPSGHPEIMISVTDAGPGISTEDQAKLFQPFSQVDSSPTRKTGGSGLGLSISQHLVQMHGGRIGLHSSPGKGSTFYFTLPVYRGKDDVSNTTPNKVVLAIDDDPQVISLYERYLQPQGYQVISLTDPSKTKDRVRQLKPFAVTLDIMMPGYDGWQVIKELKADPETRNIPVIICSIIEDEEKGFNLGAADYLIKPILEDDLLNALNRLNSDGSIREVLVIDDDADDLRLISKILTENGRYKPLLAEGGKQGWEVITTAIPHAIILDLFMDDLDGFSILERLRSEQKYRHIPVLVVTGGELTIEQKEQLNAFGQRLLQKGMLNEDELLTTLEDALKRITTNTQ